MGSVGDLLSGAVGQIGRYFSVLSILPSALLVVYVYALMAAGAWGGSPDWNAAARSLSHLGLAGILELLLVTFLVGLALQPLQYALTQGLEGYWGVSRLSVRAMSWRARHHRARQEYLHSVEGWAAGALAETRDRDPNQVFVENELLPQLLAEGEAARLLTHYPEDPNDIRPTRLGNMLRRYEVRAGAPYKLDAVTVVPHLAHVAPEAEVAYLDDQRTALDLAVRMVVVAGLAACASVLFLWRAGPWVLLAIPPYALMYASYRGAVTVAGGYGIAFSVVVDLNRFALYERLGLRRPENTEDEREQNAMLMELLDGSDDVNLAYPAPTSGELSSARSTNESAGPTEGT